MLDAVCGTCAHARVRRVCPCAQPFWPEGLGINRGFLHVLDCADLVQGYAALLGKHGRQMAVGHAQASERAEEAAALLQRREEVSAHNQSLTASRS